MFGSQSHLAQSLFERRLRNHEQLARGHGSRRVQAHLCRYTPSQTSQHNITSGKPRIGEHRLTDVSLAGSGSSSGGGSGGRRGGIAGIARTALAIRSGICKAKAVSTSISDPKTNLALATAPHGPSRQTSHRDPGDTTPFPTRQRRRPRPRRTQPQQS